MTNFTTSILTVTTSINNDVRAAVSLLNLDGNSLNARVKLNNSYNRLSNLVENTLRPNPSYARSTTVYQKALSVIADYIEIYEQEFVSVVPPTASIIAVNDMAGLNALAVRANATHIAKTDGLWSASATWDTGTIPGNSAVARVSTGVCVVYDLKSSVSLYGVQVAGQLNFATSASTRMVVGDLVAPMGSELNICPASGFTASIEFAGGNLNTSLDTRLIGRGLVTMGRVSILGEFVTPYVRLYDQVSAGVKTLRAREIPVNWDAGDTLVITPVSICVNGYAHSEILTVASVTNSVITLQTSVNRSFKIPLAAISPKDTQRGPYVANRKRNVVFKTLVSTSLNNRGHVMIMSQNSRIKNAKFSGLGRTNKAVRAVDVDSLETVSAKANIKGRYSIHLHRTGHITSNVSISYNYVSGNPGWGIAHHESNADINYNVVNKVLGAGIVTEFGNERGAWNNNLVVNMVPVSGQQVKSGADVNANDFFRTGISYAFAGRNVDTSGNIASGFGTHAYAWLHRFPSNIKQPILDYKTLEYPETARYASSVDHDFPVIRRFSNNEAFVGKMGFEVVKNNTAQKHNDRTFWTSINIWEVEIGGHLQYTAHYTLKDFDIISNRITNKNGIGFWSNADMVFTSIRIRDFKSAYNAPSHNQIDNYRNGSETIVVANANDFVSCETTITGTFATCVTQLNYSQLPLTDLSVVYTSSYTSYPTSNANKINKGTFIDAIGNTTFPIAHVDDQDMTKWGSKYTGLPTFETGALAFLGVFVQPSTLSAYIGFKDVFHDRFFPDRRIFRNRFIKIASSDNTLISVVNASTVTLENTNGVFSTIASVYPFATSATTSIPFIASYTN